MGSIGPSPVQHTPYQVSEYPSRQGRRIRIVVIGCGASAINFAHEVDSSSLDLELVCYDKNPSIGGTWYENKYPGCGCDIPSVNYQFSWAPSAEWTSFYSSAGEILQYFKTVVKDYGLMKYMRLNSRVVGAIWDEESAQWHLQIERTDGTVFEDRAHILINASGVLNKWKWPAIPGRETFKGPMLHSANWDDTVELKDKRVAVIGSGSSAVQIVPNIQPIVQSLTCFIRSQSWVTASFGQRFAGKGGTNFQYSEEQREVFRNDPKKYLAYRKKIESELNSRFQFILNGSKQQADARALKAAEHDMRTRLAKKPELADLLIPTNFAVGCRRPTPGAGYLEALCEDNVTVVSQTITKITPRGIQTADGIEHEVDVIVCATGFDVSWKPAYPTIGREGRSLSKEWADAPSTYLSITVPHFPNYLIFNGPFGPYGHGSFLPITETLSRHFLSILTKLSDEGILTFDVKESAVADFTEHRRTFLPRTAWSSPCRSWFKQGTVDGEIMMWPGSRIHFFETMKRPRWEDYHLTYVGTNNRFGYLGNGFAAREFDGRDLSWYLGYLEGEGEEDVQPELRDEEFHMFMKQQWE
ncbi:flavin-containing monooxygenase [Aspergillus ibericus CBS 121593]|uniref:Steroid monooxygenase n=1 Tax=Aspergillus ibericus CBS 121593 TaxID=1448316 RepID=A0A395H588_9EURO|nr:steroid monooxygenase [Aspergillus ibericus CBS 121593]RAL02669.1 steroid monooxygenase [Aspergillus ibericus CBS 121593]